MPKQAFQNQLGQLKRRVIREASQAIDMLERALDALWQLDKAAARSVRRRDDRIDIEEVAIEQECYRLMTLEQPVAGDFRVLAFILKVNSTVERVADHAASIGRLTQRMACDLPPMWPTALLELGQRVPMLCHALMRAVLSEDADAARDVVAADDLIDQLDSQVYTEAVELIKRDPQSIEVGLTVYRVSRELERVGDLMANIAEDVVYLVTGDIIRHAKRQAKGPRE